MMAQIPTMFINPYKYGIVGKYIAVAYLFSEG
jgi:hypothetical protein